MRHFLLVTGAIVTNFALWALFTKLPVHVMVVFCLVVATGCLMLWTIVHFGKDKDDHPSAENKS